MFNLKSKYIFFLIYLAKLSYLIKVFVQAK